MSLFSNLVIPPLSVAYSAVTALRTAAYEKGLLKTSRLPVPVISVGNITVGGTGKTPLVAWISRALANEGRKVCVLTRGYGRSNPRHRIVVSDGSNVLADVAQSGDEPFWLAQSLKGVAPVICDSDRAAAGQWAIANLGVDVFVLDDGFQHLQLARDLNVLAIDATDPWGGRRMLPNGRLRESLRGVSRADCAIITRAEQAPNILALRNQLHELLGDRPVFTSEMQTHRIRRLGPRQTDLRETIPQPVLAFCAIGNPISFFNHLRKEGLEVTHARAFPDHYKYKGEDIAALSDDAKNMGAASLITTAKDEVKLGEFDFELPCYVVDITISIDHEDGLRELIRNAIEH
jgi:tetraacyldisaccharide 4'-kinase